jgi:penicillin-insensitive murein DD-endopeptidase
MKIFIVSFVLTPSIFSRAGSIPTGHPNKGTLQSGENLYKVIKDHPDILESRSPEEFQYGTSQMADTLLSIGTWAKEFKRVPVWVGDVSKKEGGQLAQHQTHQRGLDADVAYLVKKHKLSGHRSNKFHDRFTEQFGMNGKLEENFDLESNYKLFGRILNDPGAMKIFVGCEIYEALEAYDKTRPHSIMQHIYAQKGHEDHFHIRLKCPSDVSDCSEDWVENPLHNAKKKKPKDSGLKQKYRNC